MPPINQEEVTTGVMPERLQRRCKMAFVALGEEQQEFAARKGISKWRLSKMVSGTQIITPSYAKVLNELLDEAEAELQKTAA